MLYYVVPSVFWLCYCLYWSSSRSKPTTAQSLIAFLPLIFVVCIRGNVGTDTATYITEVSLKLDGEDRPLGEFEPGFEFVVGILGGILHNARAVVLMVAAINAILFYVSLKKWGGYRLIGAAILVPGFFFDYTMNGLRAGMALPLCILAYVSWEDRRALRGVLWAALAVSVQMTSIVFLGLLLAYKLPFRFSWRGVGFGLLMLAGCGALFATVFSERILAKVGLYEFAASPSALSGLAPLLIGVVLALPFFDDVRSRAFRASLKLIALQFVFFELATLTYAGLRFQLLCLFAQALVVQREFAPRRYSRSVLAACSILFFVLCMSWKMRNFGDEQGIGESPYLPYEFFWQASDPT